MFISAIEFIGRTVWLNEKHNQNSHEKNYTLNSNCIKYFIKIREMFVSCL